MEYKILLPGGMDCKANFASGQAFRWREDVDGSFVGIANGYFARVSMQGSELIVNSDGPKEFWQDYFASDLDYDKLKEIFNQDERLRPCIEYAQGIRILRQPFFETLCSFIISQNNNIPRIIGIIEHLCEALGEKLDDNKYAFPTAKALATQTVESLAPLRAGFRAKYLLDAARKVDSGEISEENLRLLTTEQARSELIKIYGVGTKVANCTLLFSLGRNEVIPMDVHMKRAMETYFPTGLLPQIIPLGGIAQQFIFNYTRLNSK